MDKRNDRVNGYVTYGFWAMLALIVLSVGFSLLKVQIVSDVLSILFLISLAFVFINSIRCIAPPEKRTAYVALGVSILLLLIMLVLIFAMALGGTSVSSLG
jgi:small-conductance mechanosensitive channel